MFVTGSARISIIVSEREGAVAVAGALVVADHERDRRLTSGAVEPCLRGLRLGRGAAGAAATLSWAQR